MPYHDHFTNENIIIKKLNSCTTCGKYSSHLIGLAALLLSLLCDHLISLHVPCSLPSGLRVKVIEKIDFCVLRMFYGIRNTKVTISSLNFNHEYCLIMVSIISHIECEWSVG